MTTRRGGKCRKAVASGATIVTVADDRGLIAYFETTLGGDVQQAFAVH